jgi:hypothetical protein
LSVAACSGVIGRVSLIAANSSTDQGGTLEFKLDHAAWDERRRELNVVYEANLNGERKRACEIMQFDTSGRQIRGEALYGVII